MINDAMEFAAKAHEGQFRKGTRRPYIVHPIEVADIVSTMTKDEEVICAAVLHDTIEDCRGITWDVLKLRFGSRVADMVAQESEDKSKSWEERKGATISRLQEAPVEVQMIGLADKLSNDNARNDAAKAVQTGDSTNLILWAVVLGAAFAAGGIVLIVRKKKSI